MKLLGKSWKYINEGNAHIVVELSDTNCVLRLIKEDENPIQKEHIKESVDFVNLVMVPLFENHSYGYSETVVIPEESLIELRKKLQQFRPIKRLNKTLLSPFAIKVANLSIVSSKCNSNYCVEIKPKEGFLASSLKAHSKCYYCLKQYLKVQNKDITETSGYCPLDLFSGDRRRMKTSLQNMIKNPQNNFKLFKNGMVQYHEKLCKTDNYETIQNSTMFDSTNLLIDFIIEVLIRDKSMPHSILKETSTFHQEIPTDITERLCNESNNLKPNNLLYDLLKLQKLSETVTCNTDQCYNYVPIILDQLKTMKLNLNLQKDREIFFKTASPIHLLLISAIAKDCSIMISFSTDYIENSPFIDVQTLNNKGSRVYYKVALTDLEPKSMATLIKRKQTEKKMIDIYEKYIQLNKESDCKIQPHSETRAKQLEAWQELIIEYLKSLKLSTIDVREAQSYPLFNNVEINRKLSQDDILTILDDMAKTGRATPIDKSRNVWEIYWHSLEEWGNLIYNWACNNGMNNTVCTLYELKENETTSDQEFHGLSMSVLTKALKTLEQKGKCELMEYDEYEGVKFF